MTKLKITETSLRDGHQSLIATRLTTEEILPILSEMDDAGYYSMEVKHKASNAFERSKYIRI